MAFVAWDANVYGTGTTTKADCLKIFEVCERLQEESKQYHHGSHNDVNGDAGTSSGKVYVDAVLCAVGGARRQGTVEIAAHQVLMQLWTLGSFLLDSLAVGGQVGSSPVRNVAVRMSEPRATPSQE